MDLSISKGQVNDVTVLVNNTEVTVQQANNIVIEVTPSPTQYVAIDRGLTGSQGVPGVGVPTGGTTGQVLAKTSNTNYDTTWVNAAAGTGTVTSVGLSAPTGLAVSNSPVTTSGTLALSYASGYSIPTTAKQATWDTALQDITSVDGSVTVVHTGTTADLSVAIAGATNNVICQVRNTTGATLTKGTAVYISGATGQLPTVSKALATSDATSAQTLGLLTADLANNANGNVTVIGLITNMDTSAFTDGQQLYLSSTTAGALTATKQFAPAHLVYVAVVEHAHPTQGKLFVKVQNGYEMDELHNVSAQTPSNGNTLIWNASTSLWEAHGLTAGSGVSVTNGAGSITVANTAPDQTVVMNSGTGISVTGTYPNFTVTNTSPSSGGTVTSVTGTAPVVSSGGNNPAISMAKATSLVDGYLSSVDWNTFNNKQPAGSYLTAITADAPLSGSGTSGSHLVIATANTTTTGAISSTDWNTFNNKQAALVSGTNIKTVNSTSLLGSGDVSVGVTSVTGTAPVVSSGGATPAISMAKATTSVDGYLAATDFTTFNNKGNGTVTSVAALTLGTTGTDLSSSVATGTTTPVITLNVPTASGTNRGVLSSADWTTFNNKQPAGAYLTTVTADAPLSGSGTSGSHLVIATANTTTTGAISSTDWNTFNGKQAALVSGTNIKTVNGTSLLGSGDVSVGVTQIIAGTNVTISPTGGTGAVTINASGGGGGGSPAGANTQIQFNNSGAFGASSALTWDGTTAKATNVETTGGVLADGVFSGTYVDGIVVDYDSVGASGRISVGGADSLKFYNGGVSGSLLGSINNNGDWSIARFLDIGNGTLIGGATNPIFAAAGSANQYIQAYVHNDLAGTSASSDFACYPDNGTDASGWIDMGITSSVYADSSYPITGANEGYIFMSAPSGAGKTGNLVYATDSTGSSNAHQWYVGGFGSAKTAWKMQLNSSGLSLANALSIANGGTGQTSQTAAFDALSPLTTKGDVIAFNGTDNVRLPVGADTQILAADSTTATGLKWITAGGFAGGTLTSNLTLAAGTTSLVPLTMQTGTLNTTANAGAIEYDGTAFYSSMAASSRGYLATQQIQVLTSNYTLTSQTAAQKLLNATTNGAITLPIGTYEFECQFLLTGMSATAGTFGFALGGTATKTQNWMATASKSGTTATTITTGNANAAYQTMNAAANTALCGSSTNTAGGALIKGFIRITVAGTVIPQVSLSVAAAAIVQAGSYFKITPISASSTTTTIGNWS